MRNNFAAILGIKLICLLVISCTTPTDHFPHALERVVECNPNREKSHENNHRWRFGRIGREVDRALSDHHGIVRVGVRSGDMQYDYTDCQSIRVMFEKIGRFDSLISVAGSDSIFKSYPDLDDDDYRFGFERKFLGQVRLLRVGETFVRDRGSFVFTSGFLSHYSNPASIATGPLNAAIDTFARNTAPLLARGVRLNVVSPAPIVEPGQERKGLITAQETAKRYVEAVEGNMTGKVLQAWGGLPVEDN